MGFLTAEQRKHLVPAETLKFRPPVPTRAISNGEFTPWPQTRKQREVEVRIRELSREFAARQHVSQERYLQSPSGMAAAFSAMNAVHGNMFDVAKGETTDKEAAKARAKDLSKQFVFDVQTHFVRDDAERSPRQKRLLGFREYTAKELDPTMGTAAPTLTDFKFENYMKEVFLDSDTKIALITSSPGDESLTLVLNNEDMASTRRVINAAAGSRRMLAHAIVSPGRPGWMDDVDRAIELKPDSIKGYTIGDPDPTWPSKFRWRLDDEKLVYPLYEKMDKAGIRTLCVHKGILPADAESINPGVEGFANVDDVGKAARDWPQLNFIIYHAGYRVVPKPTAEGEAEFEKSGQIDWVTQLAGIPEKYGVSNVYGEIGASFAFTAVTHPRMCTGMVATLIKGMGLDHVLWGTDAVWFGSPQWQIEALRRIEVPEDLQKKFGWAPLGTADGPGKRAILGESAAKIYGINTGEVSMNVERDRLATLKSYYEENGTDRSNQAYGYVAPDSSNRG